LARPAGFEPATYGLEAQEQGGFYQFSPKMMAIDLVREINCLTGFSKRVEY
jgi:hypothetical protein